MPASWPTIRLRAKRPRMHRGGMRTLSVLLPCLALGAFACVDAPAPAPASPESTAPVAPPPLNEARLPRALRGKLTDAPPARLDVSITADAVYVDDGRLFDATPAARRAQLWPTGRPKAVKVAPLTNAALDATGLARLQATLNGSAKRGPNIADVQLMADADMPYSTVLQVLGQVRAVGYKRWWIRARGRTTNGAFRVRRARWCAEAISAKTPCTITHALITDKTTFLQNRSHTEAACGVPPAPAPPKPITPLFKGERGACKFLRHQGKQVAAAIVPPHRQRMIKGTRCAHATVAAWPTATWTQVVEIADGLRAAGHETIALSAAEQGETCVADAVAPGSAAPGSTAPGSVAPAAPKSAP